MVKKTTEKPKRKATGAAAMGAGPGRPKGLPNKTTVAVKQALEETFAAMGGVKALTTWAKGNPDEFYKLWAKLLPKDLHISGNLALESLVTGEGSSEE